MGAKSDWREKWHNNSVINLSYKSDLEEILPKKTTINSHRPSTHNNGQRCYSSLIRKQRNVLFEKLNISGGYKNGREKTFSGKSES